MNILCKGYMMTLTYNLVGWWWWWCYAAPRRIMPYDTVTTMVVDPEKGTE